ncbi:MAG TPA: FliH/SctL family protein [Acetomicrobium sp.]|nr:FliH/SctL family protein [Acetomicrobium sp.]
MSKGDKLFRTVHFVPHAVKIISKTNLEHLSKSHRSLVKEDVASDDINGPVSLEELKRKFATLKDQYELLQDKYDQLQCEYEKLKSSLELEKKSFFGKVNEEIEKTKVVAKKEGYDDGFKKGLKEGKSEAEKKAKEEVSRQVSDLIRSLENCHESLSHSMDILLKQNTMKMIRLWEKVLKSLLYKEVELDEEVLERLLEEVLKRLSDKDRIIIYLHPSEVALLQEKIDQFSDLIRGSGHVEFIADDHVDRGSCIVETNLGVYDARWRTQLERLSEEIDRLLAEGQRENDFQGRQGSFIDTGSQIR